MNLRLLVAEDHAMFRELLIRQLQSIDTFDVIGQAGNGREAVEEALSRAPDIVLMDVDMPDMNGIAATRRLQRENPSIKVINVSVHSDERTMVRCFEAGAVGYLPKKCALEDLIEAIRTVAKGQVYVSPSVAGVLIEHLLNRPDEKKSTSSIRALSEREQEVLQLIAEGQNTKEIAFKLNVSVKTIESHRKNIMDKLDLRSVAELTKFAVREGLTALHD
ncbi:MAG TPA: response regulator transcription factor [Acidobacteriota bacterium]|nr:response regulator transcription factor [Acidobacteriota bacterium]